MLWPGVLLCVRTASVHARHGLCHLHPSWLPPCMALRSAACPHPHHITSHETVAATQPWRIGALPSGHAVRPHGQQL